MDAGRPRSGVSARLTVTAAPSGGREEGIARVVRRPDGAWQPPDPPPAVWGLSRARHNRAMADAPSAFDDLLLRLEQIGQRVARTDEGQAVELTRDEVLVVLDVVRRMARGFQVLERRGLR